MSRGFVSRSVWQLTSLVDRRLSVRRLGRSPLGSSPSRVDLFLFFVGGIHLATGLYDIHHLATGLCSCNSMVKRKSKDLLKKGLTLSNALR